MEIQQKQKKNAGKNFPAGFLWGAATSSHQIEGGCLNNWTQWEKKNASRLAEEAAGKWQAWQQEKFPEMFDPANYISGRTCDHYHRFEEDFDLAKEGGHNAHRFSLEWSRIEPEEGKFDEKEIEHYRRVILALRQRGMEPLVTLWHWTHPVWLEETGGVENKKFSFYFSRYAQKMGEKLGDLVVFWVTINEPTSVINNCYWQGVWPPQKRSLWSVWRVYENLASAHRKAYSSLRKISPQFQVGFANIMTYFEPNKKHSLLDKVAVKAWEYWVNQRFLNLTEGRNDFLALQYYFHKKISFWGKIKQENSAESDLGWEIYQEGLYFLLKKLSRYGLPIYITENGLADAADDQREQFIKEGLSWVQKAIREGVKVKGFFYWSLLDNFEWDKGFWPRFGLVEVDFETLERKPRRSFYAYQKIIKNNAL